MKNSNRNKYQKTVIKDLSEKNKQKNRHKNTKKMKNIFTT